MPSGLETHPAMRRMRRQLTARVGAGRSPQRRRDRDDATTGIDDLIRLAQTGACLLPPPLPRVRLAPGR